MGTLGGLSRSGPGRDSERPQLGSGVIVLKDPLSIPTAIGQIDGTCLRQPHSMAEASASEAPDTRPLSINNKQRAGQTAKRAPDRIQFQHHS